ncbi:unnamed protein product [Trichogramma brassicae]|uniref:Uncharacterized protein n=1 Tax=Trichogramma brassicae TaxID=86971 RepID=A0A6H5J4C9_9HYME|nr:unnamed protein product [Trichogramma brassicae]
MWSNTAALGSVSWPQVHCRIAAEKRCDSNVVDVDGETPLHMICYRAKDDDLLKLFFKINEEVNQSVQVDAVDESGHTPLRWAVARLWPDIVDLLLDRSAKLSNFVFPTEDHFDKCSVFENKEDVNKWILASGALAVMDNLEKRGYELGRSDVLTIMKLFAKLEVIEDRGYEDEPEVDEVGKPLLRRTTALHHAARDNFPHSNIFRALFRIYHRLDVNYFDESGLSHFHVACMYSCNEVIKEFLELGQDPSCIWEKTGATPLHSALYYNYNEVAETLLRSGTNSNLADKNGLTPLHFICSRSKDHNDPSIFLQKFFKII